MMLWPEFATQLFAYEDADPMYYALQRADLPTPQKMRFMVGWCTYYHPGIAACASQYTGHKFWSYLTQQYATAPRASERRHFRGQAGLKALSAWRYLFPAPEKMVEHMQGDTYFDVREKAKTVPQIGQYFVWKFADVQERVFGIPCSFHEAARYSPKVPQEGAKLISQKWTIEETYTQIAKWLNQQLKAGAPPRYDRPYNMQEAETVCCVYHQYVGGSYWPMSRTAKAIIRLRAYRSSVSDHLIEQFRVASHKVFNNPDIDLVTWARQVLDKDPV